MDRKDKKWSEIVNYYREVADELIQMGCTVTFFNVSDEKTNSTVVYARGVHKVSGVILEKFIKYILVDDKWLLVLNPEINEDFIRSLCSENNVPITK